MDPGRREGMAGVGPGRRNRFAVTCALLRQYMRQNQRQVQMGNVARVFQQAPPPSPAPAPAPAPVEHDDRTMQLFPVQPAAAAMAPPAQERPEVNKAPMTIFYGGQVMLFNEFPADRANQLLQTAGSSVTSPPPPEKVVVVDVPEDAEPSAAADQLPPIARKASLQRFIKKRKHRIVNGADEADNNEEASPAKKMDAGGSQLAMEDVPDALWLRL